CRPRCRRRSRWRSWNCSLVVVDRPAADWLLDETRPTGPVARPCPVRIWDTVLGTDGQGATEWRVTSSKPPTWHPGATGTCRSGPIAVGRVFFRRNLRSTQEIAGERLQAIEIDRWLVIFC